MIPDKFYPYSRAQASHVWNVYQYLRGEWILIYGYFDEYLARKVLNDHYTHFNRRHAFALDHTRKHADGTTTTTRVAVLEAIRDD